jgi:hypothetical protein
MSEIKQRKPSEAEKESHTAALRQYANDDGHFSLVRCVRLGACIRNPS